MEKPTKEELRARVEAIKALKEEYFIGSQSAFNYLKAVRYFEGLCSKINPLLEPENRLNASEMSAFYHNLIVAAYVWLEFISAASSNTDNFSVASEHSIANRLSFQGDCTFPDSYVWEIDVELFMVSLIKALKDKSKIKKVVRSVKGIFRFFNTAGLFGQFLINAKTGERVSGYNIARDSKFRLGYLHDFWELVEIEADSERIHSDKLRVAFNAKNIGLCHDILCQQRLEDISIELRGRGFTSDITREESELLLNSGNLYKTAKNEFTLHTIAVERQILLGIALSDFSHGQDIPEFLETLHEILLKKRQEARELLGRLVASDAPKIILENQRGIMEKANYIYLAFRKNRPWLLEFLSR